MMGSELYPAQKHLLQAALGTSGRVTLMLDGDKAGRDCQKRCIKELVPHLYVKSVELPDGVQPDQLAANDIRHLLSN